VKDLRQKGVGEKKMKRNRGETGCTPMLRNRSQKDISRRSEVGQEGVGGTRDLGTVAGRRRDEAAGAQRLSTERAEEETAGKQANIP